MSLYSLYDSLAPRFNHTQRVNGGRKRAATAKRDRWGRMLPKNDTVSIPDPIQHGRAGGVARAIKAKRNKGKFAPNA